MIHHFWLFALASFLLNITPGNDMLYVASRSTGQGVRAGIVSALGVMAGCFVHVAAAAVGLSAIIASSATAFGIIKFAGAGYLVYLGLKGLFNRKATQLLPAEKVVPASYRRVFFQGALTNILNPKVALFFLAFLPQFIDIRATHARGSILLLGAWFDAGGTLINVLVAFLFGRIGDFLRRSPRWIRIQEKLTGLLLIALGIKIIFVSKK